jgi:hypothetical protein
VSTPQAGGPRRRAAAVSARPISTSIAAGTAGNPPATPVSGVVMPRLDAVGVGLGATGVGVGEGGGAVTVTAPAAAAAT